MALAGAMDLRREAWAQTGAGGETADAPRAAPEAAAAIAADPRPRAWAYEVIDGRGVPAPLGGAQGDPARGRAIFADPATGGCTACHSAPGLPRKPLVPAILGERLLQALPPEADLLAAAEAAVAAETAAAASDDAASAEAAEPAPPAHDSRSAAAPEAMSPPPARPDPEALARARAEAEAQEDAESEAAEDAFAAPILPLPQGPDMSGVAARLSEAQLRLTVINPRIRRPSSRMPAYHDVSLALGERAPGLRQPWLEAQAIEDLVAYLSTLTMPAALPLDEAPEAREPAAEDPAAPTAPAAAEAASQGAGEATSPGETDQDGGGAESAEDDAGPETRREPADGQGSQAAGATDAASPARSAPPAN